MDKWTIETPNPICRLFFQLTDFAAFCLTDSIDWRYIHLWFVFSTQLVNCCPHGPMEEGIILVYCCPSTVPSLWPPPPSPSSQCTVYADIVWLWGGGGGVLKCTVDHILQEFYTLFLARLGTYKIASPPQTKMTSKDDIKGLVSLKFLRPCWGGKAFYYPQYGGRSYICSPGHSEWTREGSSVIPGFLLLYTSDHAPLWGLVPKFAAGTSILKGSGNQFWKFSLIYIHFFSCCAQIAHIRIQYRSRIHKRTI